MSNRNGEWDYNPFPLAHLITIRTYGTWLHGDDRHSVDTHDDYNIYGTPDRGADKKLHDVMKENMKNPSFTLDLEQRRAVKTAINEVCEYRGYRLLALNVRTNHIHVVASAGNTPETVAREFKRYATRKLRSDHLVSKNRKVWSRGESCRYLWKQHQVEQAIGYVLYQQGDSAENIDIT
jgi:REP element-mobilizing transposase RayT